MKKIFLVVSILISLFCISCVEHKEEGYIELSKLFESNYDNNFINELKSDLSYYGANEINCKLIHSKEISQEAYLYIREYYGFDFVSVILIEMQYAEIDKKNTYVNKFFIEFESKAYANQIFLNFFNSQQCYQVKNNIIYIETASAYLFWGENTIEDEELLYNDTREKLLRGVNQSGELVLTNGITEILNFAFRGNNITKLVCNLELKKIGRESFFRNYNLKYIEFGSKLEYIGHSAFAECDIDYVVIPKGVLYIGDQAFTKGTIFCEAKKKPSFWAETFVGEEVKVYWQDQWKYDESGKPVVIIVNSKIRVTKKAHIIVTNYGNYYIS